MKLTNKFTQVPDEWWKLVGKHTVVDKNGKEKSITISHWTIVLIAKIASFNSVRTTEANQEYVVGKCTASNAYFADLLNVSQQTVKNTLSDLYTLGLLKSYEQREGKRTLNRFLYVNEDVLNALLRGDSTPQSTGVVPHEVLGSTPQSTTKYPTEYPNNKEKERNKKDNNIGETFSPSLRSKASNEILSATPQELNTKNDDSFSLEEDNLPEYLVDILNNTYLEEDYI